MAVSGKAVGFIETQGFVSCVEAADRFSELGIMDDVTELLEKKTGLPVELATLLPQNKPTLKLLKGEKS